MYFYYDIIVRAEFIAWVCLFNVITLFWAKQCNYFENENKCSKCTLKTGV